LDVDEIRQCARARKSWRDVLKIHPAADLFPMMAAEEMKALGADIKARGLVVPVVLWSAQPGSEKFVLDGRNRLDSMEAAGIDFLDSDLTLKCHTTTKFGADAAGKPSTDPYEFVLSTNIHRRNLTPEQKRELIAKLLKAQPEKSNRQIAEQTKVDHKTVGTVRDKLEGRGEIPHVEKVVDSKGRNQPAKRKSVKAASDDCDLCHGTGRVKGLITTPCGTPTSLHVDHACPRCDPVAARKDGVGFVEEKSTALGNGSVAHASLATVQEHDAAPSNFDVVSFADRLIKCDLTGARWLLNALRTDDTRGLRALIAALGQELGDDE